MKTWKMKKSMIKSETIHKATNSKKLDFADNSLMFTEPPSHEDGKEMKTL